MEFKDYTDKAVNRFGLRGQNAVAREIGITTASMSNLMSGKILPSDETMLKLADLAGCPKEQALIDLNLWRAKKNPEVEKIWKNLSKMIDSSMLFLFIFNILHYSDSITYFALHYILCKFFEQKFIYFRILSFY